MSSYTEKLFGPPPKCPCNWLAVHHAWAVKDELSAPARWVLLCLSARMGESKNSCWPSYDTLTEETCLGRTKVAEAIVELEQKGFLGVRRKNGKKNIYYLYLGIARRRPVSTGTGEPDDDQFHRGPQPVSLKTSTGPVSDSTGPAWDSNSIQELDPKEIHTGNSTQRAEPSKRKQVEKEAAVCVPLSISANDPALSVGRIDDPDGQSQHPAPATETSRSATGGKPPLHALAPPAAFPQTPAGRLAQFALQQWPRANALASRGVDAWRDTAAREWPALIEAVLIQSNVTEDQFRTAMGRACLKLKHLGKLASGSATTAITWLLTHLPGFLTDSLAQSTFAAPRQREIMKPCRTFAYEQMEDSILTALTTENGLTPTPEQEEWISAAEPEMRDFILKHPSYHQGRN